MGGMFIYFNDHLLSVFNVNLFVYVAAKIAYNFLASSQNVLRGEIMKTQ